MMKVVKLEGWDINEDEGKFFERIVKGQEAFNEMMKKAKEKDVRVTLTKPCLKDGKITFTVTIPIAFLKGHVGDWDKDGVEK